MRVDVLRQFKEISFSNSQKIDTSFCYQNGKASVNVLKLQGSFMYIQLHLLVSNLAEFLKTKLTFAWDSFRFFE